MQISSDFPFVQQFAQSLDRTVEKAHAHVRKAREALLEAGNPRDRSRRQFGLLEFRGGLVLRSPNRNFGGISAIRVAANMLNGRTGRAWIAIRDSEIAAQSMGVNLSIYKSIAFAYSAALMGLAVIPFSESLAAGRETAAAAGQPRSQ